MAQTIKLRRSATASAVPTTGQLALGELAINTFDGKLFLKKDNGIQSIVEVGAAGAVAGANTQIQFNNSGAFGASSDFTWDNTAKKHRINGQLALNGATSIAAQFYFGGTAPSGTDVYSIYTDQTISAVTTGSASAVTSNLSTAAAAFTLPSLNHFVATKGTFGAGSTVTTQRGFYAHNTLTGATNNYGFFSDIAAGTNCYNFYANGTALNFFQGAVGMGNGALAYTQLRIGGTAPSSSNLTYSVYADQTAPATTTSEFASFYSTPSTAASAFTLGTMFHYIATQGTIGAGSAITNQFGFYVANNLTGATNNYGFYSNIPSGTNRWNFYANGTAQNYFGGATTFNSTVTMNTALGLASGGTGQTTAPAAMAALSGYTTTATAAGTTVLTNASSHQQFFTGTSTQTITLPSTATLTLGWPITITNNSTGNLSVQTSTAVALGTVLPGTTMEFTCVDTAVNTAAGWGMEFTGVQTVTGTGNLVLATSPTLVTPALGTPASGNLANCTFPTLNQNTTGTASNVTGTVAAANGGTGQTTYAVGDLLYASATNALSKLADVATGNALISGGVGVAPSYGKVGLTTHISGTLAVGNGGTGATTLTGLVKGNGTSAFTAAVAGTDYIATMPSGSYTLLNTLTASNSVALQDTTSLTASYDWYEIVLENIQVVNTSNTLYIQVYVAGYQATNYYYQEWVYGSAGAATQTTTGTYIPLAQVGNLANTLGGTSGYLRIFRPSIGTTYKAIMGQTFGPHTVTTIAAYQVNGFWGNGTTAITGFQIAAASGNLLSGTIKIYGVKA